MAKRKNGLRDKLSTQVPLKLREGTYGSTRRRAWYAEVICTVCNVQFEAAVPLLRLQEGATQAIRCNTCRGKRMESAPKPKPKKATKAAPLSGAEKLLAKVLANAKWNELPASVQAAARAIVERHVAACRSLGAPVERLDRVYEEAIEEAQWEQRHGVPEPAALPPAGPRWKFEQYMTPTSPTF